MLLRITINYTFWITRFYQLTFFCHTKQKKEPVTETNPQQALGFIKYVVCPFVIINVACIFTRFHKDKYCFSLSQIRMQKKRTP